MRWWALLHKYKNFSAFQRISNVNAQSAVETADGCGRISAQHMCTAKGGSHYVANTIYQYIRRIRRACESRVNELLPVPVWRFAHLITIFRSCGVCNSIRCMRT